MTPYLPPNDIGFFTLQSLKGDRRYICRYEGREHIPYCIPRKLTKEYCAPYLNSDDGPVTFTVRVPLDDGHPRSIRHRWPHPGHGV